jgi:RNA polymerase sigma-70 factor, ECF subfamily
MEPEDSDRNLAERMLSGDEAAFTEFFDGHFPRLYRFALSRLDHDADAAEEVVQTVMIQAVARLETYRGEALLFTWLCTFCRREISAWRRRRGRPETPLLPEDWPEARAVLESMSAEALPGPEDELRRKEIARLVQATLDRLPHPYGDTLEWKYLHGESVHEIASRLGLTPKAAESLLTRARNAFREAFSALVGGAAKPGASRA